MANITQLTPTLWTGGDLPNNEEAAAGHIADWLDAGITTVIDCRCEWSDQDLVAAFAPGIRYVHTGVDDAGQRIPAAWFDHVVEAANATHDDGVLVHCHMGINRGPSAAYAILLARGHDPIEAIDLIRAQRPIAAIDYAEDALRWWHLRTDASITQRRADRDALDQWRRKHPHDTIRIINTIRSQQLGAVMNERIPVRGVRSSASTGSSTAAFNPADCSSPHAATNSTGIQLVRLREALSGPRQSNQVSLQDGRHAAGCRVPTIDGDV